MLKNLLYFIYLSCKYTKKVLKKEIMGLKNVKKSRKHLYQIILTSNGKRIETLYSAQSLDKVNRKFRSLLNNNKTVKFPVKYLNVGKIIDAHYELYIIKRNEGESKIVKLKDENGKIINFQTDNDDWIIYDREDYNKEESFWVYGYHPIYQRKNFEWIFNNIIKNENTKFNSKQIVVYRNKLLICTTFTTDIVFCKNISDCIRLYNELERECKNNKIKYVFFSGDAYHSTLKKTWLNKIQTLTGWSYNKIRRNTL